MNRKTVSKILAAFLAFTLSFANVAILGIYANETYAAITNLEEQTTNVEKAEVEFDAYFQEEGNNTHSKVVSVDKEGETLYLSLKVEEGYLTNSNIKIENANFRVQNTQEELSMVQSISEEENKIVLNQISKGESAILEIPIKINAGSSFDVKDLNKTAYIKLEGTYVNNKGKEINVDKTINVEVTIDGEAESELSEEVSKYVTYNVGGSKGVILQTSIKSKIANNKLPIKATKIEIEVPMINNKEPKTITLSAKSQKATNGMAGKVFNEDEYVYEDGKVTLELKNGEETLSWLKDVEDEILLTSIYDESAIVEKAEVKLNAKSTITYYAKEQKEVVKDFENIVELTEQIGDIVTLDLNLGTNILYKGHIQNGKDTTFTDKLSLNIGYSQLVDKIIFKDETSYLDENGNVYPSSALYDYTKISEENLVQILGEEGFVNIYNANGEIITTLNKENLEYKFEEQAKDIMFETSKPKTEGILELENGRIIKALEYSKEQLEKFTTYRVNLVTNITKDNTPIIRGMLNKDIELKNPETIAELTLNKTNMSTVVENEGVEIRVTLKTKDASSALYKNPKLAIIFPTYVKDIQFETVKLLYEKELKFADTKLYRNEAGNVILEIALTGEQKAYAEDAISEGATIVMNAKITADELTPTKTEKVYLNVANENTANISSSEHEIKFIAPAGLVTVNQITGYNDKQEKATSISGKKEVGEIEINSPAKTAEVNMKIINNYEYGCENIKILGRTPFEGNKSIKGEPLGSTFTAKVVSKITANTGITNDQITVYYSENGEATKDLANAENGWTENPNNLNSIKSYMIILNGFTLNTGDSIGFGYNVEIPAGLEHNQETYGVFTVYYTKQNIEVAQNNIAKSVKIAGDGDLAVAAGVRQMLAENDETLAYEESAEAGIAGISTGEGPNLKLNLKARTEYNELTNGGNVEENDLLGYTLEIKNESNIDAENVNISVDVPDRAFYVDANTEEVNTELKKITTKVDSIKAGQTRTVVFMLKAKIYKPNTSINVTAKASVEGYTGEFSSNEFANPVISASGNPRIKMKVSSANSGVFAKGDKIQYTVNASTNTKDPLNNAEIKVKIPTGLKYISAAKNGSYNPDTREITWNIAKLASENLSMTLEIEEGAIPSGKYEAKVAVKFTATCDGTGAKFESAPYEITVQKHGLSIEQTSDMSDGYIDANEDITYVINVKNDSPATTAVTIKDTLPKELKFVKYYYTEGNTIKTYTENTGSIVEIPLTLKAEEAKTVFIVAKAQKLSKDTEITNEVKVVSREIESAATPLKHTILGTKNPPPPTDDPNNPGGDSTKNKYRISGTAWVDENRDGKRDEGEKLLSGIKVYLLNAGTNAVVKTTSTNSTGAYTFLDVEEGRYIVAFDYDTKSYDITKYQADGVDASFNSDVINMNLSLNGEKKNYAATNTIAVNTHTYNIDLGLVNSPKFDMALEKSIVLVQVSNAKGVNSYKFNNTNLAKVEIAEKNMQGSVVAITYVFKIRNEGAVSGYVGRIVDYKAKDLSFSSTLNPEWYQDTTGNLYNTTLAGKEIKPGETVELSLVLTKTMTNENTGLSNNTAELAEVSNDLGLADIDSTPANKNTQEDDFGKADVIIQVKTGGLLFYGGIVIAVLGIFAFGAYEIKKRVLNRV